MRPARLLMIEAVLLAGGNFSAFLDCISQRQFGVAAVLGGITTVLLLCAAVVGWADAKVQKRAGGAS